MKTIGQFEFPSIADEASSWKRVSLFKPLHSQVLCEAHTRIEGKWAAYCFPVPGMNHEKEVFLWETQGDKINENVARAIFPEFEGVPYAR